MKTFILGYLECISEELTVFSGVRDAEYRSEEWCSVDADSLEDAKEKYEESFMQWKLSN